MKNSRRIYLDYAASAPLRPEALKALVYYSQEEFNNPSSIYLEGREASSHLESARKEIAEKIFKSSPEEIIFTGSGTESVNLAILGVARANKNIFKKPRIISSAIEHPAVLKSLKQLEKEGFEIKICSVDNKGIINLKELEKLINSQTLLVSVMHANNEIGTIQPLSEIFKIIKKKNNFPLLHTDACQSSNYFDISKTKADLISINSSKIGGPKGVGLLFIKKGIKIEPLLLGGGQERGIRSSTENFPSIMSFSKTLLLANKKREAESARLIKLRDYLIKEITNKIPGTFLNGHPKKRLPNNINITILGIEGESILLMLDQKGFAISTGSACHSKSLQPSYVLSAINLPKEIIHGSIRITLGWQTKKSDLNLFVKELKKIVEKLRLISPINWKDLTKKL